MIWILANGIFFRHFQSDQVENAKVSKHLDGKEEDYRDYSVEEEEDEDPLFKKKDKKLVFLSKSVL